MPKFVFAYHGGKIPETPEAGKAVMKRWEDWFAGIGADIVDPGNPVGLSKTVSANGVDDNGGANPISGYTLINAADMEAAIEIAKACPILDGGTVEIAEAMDM